MDLSKELQGYITDAQNLFSEVYVANKAGRSLAFPDGISEVLNLLNDLILQDSRVFLIGNGGSAGIASEVSNRIWKFCGIPSQTFNDPVILTSSANDFGVEAMYERPLSAFARQGDLLFAISSSGKSKNIINAVQLAVMRNMYVVTLSGFGSDNPLSLLGHINFYVNSNSYRHVERTHLFVLDCVIDMLIKQGEGEAQ